MNILIADDERIITDLVTDLLTINGFDVTATNSTNKAIELINQNSYDIVLLDTQSQPLDALSAKGQAIDSSGYWPIGRIRKHVFQVYRKHVSRIMFVVLIEFKSN